MRVSRKAKFIAFVAPFVIGIISLVLWELRLRERRSDLPFKIDEKVDAITKQCQDEADQANTGTGDKRRIKKNCLCRYPETAKSQDECYLTEGMPAAKPYSPLRDDLTFANAKWATEIAHLCQLEAEKKTSRAVEQIKLVIECQCAHPLDSYDVQQCQVNRKNQREFERQPIYREGIKVH